MWVSLWDSPLAPGGSSKSYCDRVPKFPEVSHTGLPPPISTPQNNRLNRIRPSPHQRHRTGTGSRSGGFIAWSRRESRHGFGASGESAPAVGRPHEEHCFFADSEAVAHPTCLPLAIKQDHPAVARRINSQTSTGTRSQRLHPARRSTQSAVRLKRMTLTRWCCVHAAW